MACRESGDRSISPSRDCTTSTEGAAMWEWLHRLAGITARGLACGRHAQPGENVTPSLSWPIAKYDARRQPLSCRQRRRLDQRQSARGCACDAPMAIAKARSPSGNASIVSSSTSTRWFARAARTSRCHAWNRGSCVQLVEVAEQQSCSNRRPTDKSAADDEEPRMVTVIEREWHERVDARSS